MLQSKGRRAFSMIEMMVSVAIMAIMVTVYLGVFNRGDITDGDSGLAARNLVNVGAKLRSEALSGSGLSKAKCLVFSDEASTYRDFEDDGDGYCNENVGETAIRPSGVRISNISCDGATKSSASVLITPPNATVKIESGGDCDALSLTLSNEDGVTNTVNINKYGLFERN